MAWVCLHFISAEPSFCAQAFAMLAPSLIQSVVASSMSAFGGRQVTYHVGPGPAVGSVSFSSGRPVGLDKVQRSRWSTVSYSCRQCSVQSTLHCHVHTLSRWLCEVWVVVSLPFLLCAVCVGKSVPSASGSCCGLILKGGTFLLQCAGALLLVTWSSTASPCQRCRQVQSWVGRKRCLG